MMIKLKWNRAVVCVARAGEMRWRRRRSGGDGVGGGDDRGGRIQREE